MADRIFGDFQTAGFKITTTGKSQVSNDGTNAYAPAVVLVDTSGNPTGGSGTAASQIQGNVASGATDAGNPVKIGGVFNSTPPTVTSGQRVDQQMSNRGEALVTISQNNLPAQVGSLSSTFTAGLTNGVTTRSQSYVFDGTTSIPGRGDANGMVIQSALTASQWNYAGVTGGITTTTAVTVSAATATVRNYMRSIQFSNSSATASEIVVLDNVTVIWRGRAPASMTTTENITFDPPLKGSINTAMNVQMVTTGTATVVSAQGWQGT